MDLIFDNNFKGTHINNTKKLKKCPFYEIIEEYRHFCYKNQTTYNMELKLKPLFKSIGCLSLNSSLGMFIAIFYFLFITNKH